MYFIPGKGREGTENNVIATESWRESLITLIWISTVNIWN